MPVAFVMPCLNEAAMVEAATASIGFGNATLPAAEDVYLVLVDNGSIDGTVNVMERIASSSRAGAVVILKEPERGFVPPRRRGALHVRHLADSLGEPPERWLILQADADTHYLAGYAQSMQRHLRGRRGILLEGAVKRDAVFDRDYPAYRALERSVDAWVEGATVSDEDEVIVDDKVCGYLLADYLAWGGHFHEYDSEGSEVHAETTRLLLRARLRYEALKVRVNPAQAIPSRRRIIEDPMLHFATAGFPRERGWLDRWRKRHPLRRSIEAFSADPGSPEVAEALFYRTAHEIALFLLLPRVLWRLRADPAIPPADTRLTRLLALVPRFSETELATSPALAITAVLDVIEEHPHEFRR